MSVQAFSTNRIFRTNNKGSSSEADENRAVNASMSPLTFSVWSVG
jgi:hypothetical protein